MADLVLFDPDTFSDIATYEDPHQFAQGVELVLINGKVVLKEDILNEAISGKLLLRNRVDRIR